MLRPRTLAILAASAVARLLPAGAASAAAFKATLDAPNHSPKGGGTNWDITVTARSNAGKALRATARYEFLFNGQKVSTQYPKPRHPTSASQPYTLTGPSRRTYLSRH